MKFWKDQVHQALYLTTPMRVNQRKIKTKTNICNAQNRAHAFSIRLRINIGGKRKRVKSIPVSTIRVFVSYTCVLTKPVWLSLTSCSYFQDGRTPKVIKLKLTSFRCKNNRDRDRSTPQFVHNTYCLPGRRKSLQIPSFHQAGECRLFMTSVKQNKNPYYPVYITCNYFNGP